MAFARYHILALLLCGFLGAAPASADYTSYYNYYRVKPGDTLSSVAAKHGVHSGAIKAMNRNLDGELTPGSMICVPKQEKPVAKKKRKRKKRKKKSNDRDEELDDDDEEPTREEMSEEELAYVTAYATRGAKKRTRRARTVAAPRSYVIGANGRVTYVPSARVRRAPEPEPKVSKHRRVKLSSRKGKLMHKLIRSCRSYLGVPYVWGGESPAGFDCSGYVQYVYAKHGIRLPRTADIQFNVGRRVKRGKELPADLVFFETYAPGASHVGVYLGNRYFIHASSSGMVKISSLNEEYFSSRYLGARRHI